MSQSLSCLPAVRRCRDCGTEHPIGDSDDSQLMDRFVAESAIETEEEVEERLLSERIDKALGTLQPRDRRALRVHLDVSPPELTAQLDDYTVLLDRTSELYRKVRGPKSDYRWTLALLRRIKEAKVEEAEDSAPGRRHPVHRRNERLGRPPDLGNRAVDVFEDFLEGLQGGHFERRSLFDPRGDIATEGLAALVQVLHLGRVVGRFVKGDVGQLAVRDGNVETVAEGLDVRRGEGRFVMRETAEVRSTVPFWAVGNRRSLGLGWKPAPRSRHGALPLRAAPR